MLNVVMLSVILLSVAMLSVAMLSVAMLSVVMLNVVALWRRLRLVTGLLNLFLINGLAYYSQTFFIFVLLK
jgi:hypothetical protein